MAHVLTSQIPRTLSRTRLFRSSSVSCFYSYRPNKVADLPKETALTKTARSTTATSINRRSQSQPSRQFNSFKMESARRFEPAAEKKYSTGRLEREEEEVEEAEEELEQLEEDHYEDAESAEFGSFREQPESMGAWKTANLNRQAESAYKLAVRELNKEVNGYRLEIAQPRKPIQSEYNVFEHYTKLYEMKQNVVMPHLQPNNMRPYGATDTLVFPSNKPKTFSIKYPPMSESQEMPEDFAKTSSSQQREYSTLHNSEFALSTYPRKSDYAQARKVGKLLKVQEQSMNNSGPRRKHLDSSALDVKKLTILPEQTTSKDIEKCNKIISEFKRLNPDNEIKKKNLAPGSQEEKEALNGALEFAKEYRKKFLSVPITSSGTAKLARPDENLVETDEPIAEGIEEITEDSEEPPQVAARRSSPTIDDIRALARTIFDGTKFKDFKLPTVEPSAPIKLTQVPRFNVPQSSALPEDNILFDNIKTEVNEKLIAPWPAYSDALKLLSRRTASVIRYPATTTNVNLHAAAESSIPNMQTRGLTGSPDIGLSRAAREYIVGNKILNHFDRKKQKLPVLMQSKRTYCTPSSRHPLGREGTVMPKLKRLPKKKMKAPPRVCPKKEDWCAKRADEGLEVKSKTLPILKPINCPCRSDPPLQEGPPLRPPTKLHVVKPKPCVIKKVMDCVPRADEEACLTVKPKKLPKIVPGECPCITTSIKDCPPLKRLPPVEICVPKKPCKPPKASICSPRADEKLKIKPKKLPILKPPPCPCYDTTNWVDVKLPRLEKVKMKEPKRPCAPVVEFECPPRADVVYKYKPKMKVLKTLVLRESLNNMSIREFNKKKKNKKSKGKSKKAKRKGKGKKSRSSGKRKYHTKCGVVTNEDNVDGFRADMEVNVDLMQRHYKQSSSAFDSAFAFGSKTESMIQLTKEEMSSWLATNVLQSNRTVNQNVFKENIKRLAHSSNGLTTTNPYKEINYLAAQRHSRSMSTGSNSNYLWAFFNNLFGSSNKPAKEARQPTQKKEFFNETINPKPPLSGMPMARKEPEPDKPSGSRGFSTEPNNQCCPDPCTPPEKTLWQKICDYFKARPNCPPPDAWKKKMLREKAEKAAAKAGLFICDKPPQKKKLPCVITDKDVDLKEPKKLFGCQMFKMKNCAPLFRQGCDSDRKHKQCTPQPAPYPSFSQCRPPFPPIRDAECNVAETRWSEMKEEYHRNLTKGYQGKMEQSSKKSKGKRKCERSFSTSVTPSRGGPLNQKRFYSKYRGNSDDPFALFENANQEKLKNLSQKELAQKILEAVRKGMEDLEKNNGKMVEDPYYRIYKELEQLVRPGMERQLKHSAISKGQSLCGSFSDLGIFGMQKDVTRTTVPSADTLVGSDVQDYEESEKRKTNDMVRRLNELLDIK